MARSTSVRRDTLGTILKFKPLTAGKDRHFLETIMNINADEVLENFLKDSLREAVKARFSGYNSPLDKLITEAIGRHSNSLTELLESSIEACILSEDFRANIADAVNKSLAKTLIQRFGGEVEKQVNILKSDPTTRARITLAIEQIVKDANK